MPKVTSALCKGYIPRYHFCKKSGKCEKFIYGGCGGNANNFKTLQQCQQKCGECIYILKSITYYVPMHNYRLLVESDVSNTQVYIHSNFSDNSILVINVSIYTCSVVYRYECYYIDERVHVYSFPFLTGLHL